MSVNSISTWSWNAPPPWQSTTNTNAASGPSEFQQLASDIQAVLTQGQGGTATTPSSASATANPAQQLATDLQTFAQAQNGQASGDTADQTSAATQAPAHHHHHHGGGTANASGTSSSSATSSLAAASSNNSAAGLSQALAGGIMQILQAYGSQAAASTTPPLTSA